MHTLCERVGRFLPELFVLVALPGVPSHSNLAERSVRPLVIARKISGGTRSPLGSDTRMGLFSLFGTWAAEATQSFPAMPSGTVLQPFFNHKCEHYPGHSGIAIIMLTRYTYLMCQKKRVARLQRHLNASCRRFPAEVIKLMHLSLAIRRRSFAFLLLVAVLGGWSLRAIPFPQSVTSAKGSADTNVPINGDANPLSSSLDFSSCADNVCARSDAHLQNNLYQLTGGLRPGRGEPIPNAVDVHALPVQDVSFYNWRGELLSGWLSLTSPSAPVIILTHGTPGNRVSMISRAAFLHNHGFNVLLFDFQSYGKSQGVISTLGMVESEDILAAISYLHSLPASMFSKIGVLGLSMGATAAVLAASRSEDILALVAESCPVDATRVPGDVPDEASRQADKQLVEEVYGVDITQARPIDVVNKFAGRTALFFVNGDADTITPLAGMQSLYDRAGEPKQDWVVPGAQHAQSFATDPEEYMQRVDAFFDMYLG